MALKGAIFDLDGVIVNTVPLHFKAWKKMFSEYGKKFTFKDYKAKVDGIPRIDGAQAILKNLSDEELEKAATRKQKYFLDFVKARGVKVYPTTIKLIKELKSHKIKVAVISSSKNCTLMLKKAGVKKLINAEVNGRQITKGKPDPQIFLMALKKIKLKNTECIVFEDASLGVEAGKRAKIFTIGIDRYNNPKRLKRADVVITDAKEVNYKKLNNFILKSHDKIF